MKIVLCSPLFPPSVGGIERATYMLAEDLSALGCSVRVVTSTAGARADAPFEILRRPSTGQFLAAVRWSELFVQACVSLKFLWPLALCPRPYAVIHHTWYQRPDGSHAVRDRLKLSVCRHASNVCVSRALAAALAAPSAVIPNPYDPAIFFDGTPHPRAGELLFVGRLVSDKGLDLLLQALSALRRLGHTPKLTIVGSGPEEALLRRQAADLDLSAQLDWRGVVQGAALADVYRAHRAVIIPSRWNEPFGLVALEAIACGCAVLGSSGGGLPEAIGPCGRTFANNSLDELTRALLFLLPGSAANDDYKSRAPTHLAAFRRETVARRYLDHFRTVAGGDAPI